VRNGIFVRSAAAFERAASIQVIVFDKSGTLTEGKPSVTDVVAVAGLNQYDVLCLAAALAQAFNHPLAPVIVEHAKKEGITIPKLIRFTDHPGEGIEGQLDDDSELGLRGSVCMGSPAYLRSRAMVIDNQRMEQFLSAGKSVICVADRAGFAGYLIIDDQLLPTAAASVSRLKETGIELMMLSGDDVAKTAAIAMSVGIHNYRAQVLPQDKADAIRVLRTQGNAVGMIGDGIEDAKAMAIADVSIAIGAGVRVPIEATDVAVMKRDLASVADAIFLCRATMEKVRQNLFFAFIYNIVGIPLTAFGLLNPVVAGAVMVLGSVSVVSNSLLLKQWRPGPLGNVTLT
jgi:Cu+-exporting ATPase